MDNVENALNRIARTLGFLKSVIDSGEEFTDTAREEYERAFKDIEWIKSVQ